MEKVVFRHDFPPDFKRRSIRAHARYSAMTRDKACDDALNVCRVSPRVGVVTVNLRVFAIGRRKDRGPMRDSLTSLKIV